jgi:hypothetical protein
MICIQTRFHFLGSDGSSDNAIKLKIKYGLHAAIMLLYIPHKVLKKSVHFSNINFYCT